MKGVMIQGTASNVGKSWIATGLCRMFARKGVKVAPFKSQNMSNNAYVTVKGEEIGRAQGIQAEAAGVEATVEMNPILLKPTSDRRSEVILRGVSQTVWSGSEYREKGYEKGKRTIKASADSLNKEYDMLVIEGAGSPVEINLNDRELVNMSIADLLDVPVILAADIDRGGVFASIVGTLELLEEQHRKRVKGVIINKFRGERALFEDGVRWLEERTGIPVLGVLPHLENHGIEGEDSLTVESVYANQEQSLDIAVVHWPYIANDSDVNPLSHEPDVSIRYVRSFDELEDPDALILPGTRSTIDDYRTFEKLGLKEAVREYAEEGTVIGICGGYQVLCETMYEDKADQEGTAGIGLFPLSTTFFREKQTIRVKGSTHPASGFAETPMAGYEIHLGRTIGVNTTPFLELPDGPEGISLDHGRLIGTYLHDCFHNDEWRTEWLNRLRKKAGLPQQPVMHFSDRQKRYDRLADHLEKYLDHEAIREIVEGSRS
ncbi:cobyric acid synthase [Halobacillus andaensis]|uniref:Cobyric acid synthase n=1 Tax=Halobacillus andaensis TaxID=1176239 RepID=A0A917B8D7_HALAA|nr:cobyric acid synthase [Halobacillus andaensis]MBP2005187.1 adenosylcobyric acid synthase [Halobacillus andaensis]GGF29529.1 cobyric acid synthase [Halobacillus andaensis]